MGNSLIAIVILLLNVLAIISIIQSGLTTGAKALWILLVLLMPILGVILWFVIGSKRSVV